MHPQRRSRARLAVATAAGILAATAMHPRASAAPSEACDHPQLRAQVVEILVGDSEPPVGLHLHTDVITTIRTSSLIRSADAVDPRAISFAFGQRELMVKPNPDHRRTGPQLGELHAKTTDGPIAFDLRVATDPSTSIGLALVRPRLPGDKDKSALTSLGSICSLRTKLGELGDIQTTLTEREQELATKLAELEAKDAEIIEQSARHSRELRATRDRTFMTHVDDSTFSVIELDHQGCSGDEIILCPRLYTRSDNRAVLLVDARNRTNQTVPIKRARVFVKHSPHDRALLFGITDNRQRPTTVMDPGEQVTVAVVLGDPDRLGGSLKVVLDGASSALPASEWVVIESPIKQAEREFARRKRLRQARRSSLALVALGGAIWLEDGIDGTETLEPTTLTGLGLRFIKGMAPRWAFEAEFSGAASGTARFGTVVSEGMEGELSRSAKLGRLSFGGMLRFGDKTVPHVKVGVGMQLLTEESRMVASGNSGMTLERTLAADLDLYAGVGVDIRINSNVFAGAGLLFVAPQNSDRQLVKLGVQLGYRWNP